MPDRAFRATLGPRSQLLYDDLHRLIRENGFDSTQREGKIQETVLRHHEMQLENDMPITPEEAARLSRQQTQPEPVPTVEPNANDDRDVAAEQAALQKLTKDELHERYGVSMSLRKNEMIVAITTHGHDDTSERPSDR